MSEVMPDENLAGEHSRKTTVSNCDFIHIISAAFNSLRLLHALLLAGKQGE